MTSWVWTFLLFSTIHWTLSTLFWQLGYPRIGKWTLGLMALNWAVSHFIEYEANWGLAVNVVVILESLLLLLRRGAHVWSPGTLTSTLILLGLATWFQYWTWGQLVIAV